MSVLLPEPKKRFSLTQTNFEILNSEYLIPVLKFCGLYLTSDGLIKSFESNQPFVSATENKIFLVVDNYEKYNKFLANRENYIPFNPYTNERHLFIMMRWVQNTIFQTDAEFNDFFIENFNGVSIDREPTDEEIFAEASKHIILSSLSQDYRGCIRRQWIIETNLRNELINKVISEVYLPASVPLNIGVLISLRDVVDYYNMGEVFIQKDHLAEAERILKYLECINSDMRKNKEKHLKTIDTIKHKEYDIRNDSLNDQEESDLMLNKNNLYEKQYDI